MASCAVSMNAPGAAEPEIVSSDDDEPDSAAALPAPAEPIVPNDDGFEAVTSSSENEIEEEEAIAVVDRPGNQAAAIESFHDVLQRTLGPGSGHAASIRIRQLWRQHLGEPGYDRNVGPEAYYELMRAVVSYLNDATTHCHRDLLARAWDFVTLLVMRARNGRYAVHAVAGTPAHEQWEDIGVTLGDIVTKAFRGGDTNDGGCGSSGCGAGAGGDKHQAGGDGGPTPTRFQHEVAMFGEVERRTYQQAVEMEEQLDRMNIITVPQMPIRDALELVAVSLPWLTDEEVTAWAAACGKEEFDTVLDLANDQPRGPGSDLLRIPGLPDTAMFILGWLGRLCPLESNESKEEEEDDDGYIMSMCSGPLAKRFKR